MRRVGPRATPGATGAAAEDAALEYLREQGLSLIARNFAGRRGEIDLVMSHPQAGGDCLVFVEVRMRSRDDFGSAAASVTRTKQGRVVRAAQTYLARYPERARSPCRFDVVAVNGRSGEVTWIRGAFDA